MPAGMYLIEGGDVTVSAIATVTTVALPDGTELRAAWWLPPGEAAPAGSVVICTGRSEFIEKYLRTVADLLARGFAVVVFDWRGQGFSTRSLRDQRKGHIADFRLYEDDLAAVINAVVRPHCPKPYFGLAHSMGGAVMIHHAHRSCAFQRIVLSAPMVEVHDLPFVNNLRRLVGSLSRVGLGRAFVPQGRRAAVFDKAFENNVLTSDPDRFATMMAFARADPRLALGAPTIGWLSAAFRAMQPFESLDFCRAIATPILVVVPGADRVVSVPAMERFALRLKAGTLVRIPQARHEILMERDVLREQFWAAFDAFIPGERRGRDIERELGNARAC